MPDRWEKAVSLGINGKHPALPSAFTGRLASWTSGQIAALYPGCFALVMATGIISNVFFLEERRALSDALLVVNLIAYPWLIVATVLRLLRFGQRLWNDLVDPRLVFAFPSAPRSMSSASACCT